MPSTADARVCFAIALVSLAAIGFALVLQFGFGVEPCVLCTYQRIPYVVAVGFGLFGAAMPLAPPRRRLIVAICGFLFAVGAAIAVYHLGVEQGWWAGSASCTGELRTQAMTLSDMQSALSTKPKARCDAVPWTMFGFSLTTWNLAASTFLALVCAALVSERTLWRNYRFRPNP